MKSRLLMSLLLIFSLSSLISQETSQEGAEYKPFFRLLLGGGLGYQFAGPIAQLNLESDGFATHIQLGANLWKNLNTYIGAGWGIFSYGYSGPIVSVSTSYELMLSYICIEPKLRMIYGSFEASSLPSQDISMLQVDALLLLGLKPLPFIGFFYEAGIGYRYMFHQYDTDRNVDALVVPFHFGLIMYF